MGSIVIFQGRYYLVDAGPSIIDSLYKLGIDLSEIEGIFHTHGHDDHFAGLPSLILSGHRIKYYATPLVRHSVTKKLTALMSIGEEMFEKSFEICDLKEGTWNDVGGLEVMPMYSPHPVENNIFMFRAMDDDGFKTYAHWADIVSFDILGNLLKGEKQRAVIPSYFLDSVRARYLTPASVKKIDGGGGMIHGQPLDFVSDVSDKIILAHRTGPFTSDELDIGSQASFGAVDVLIASGQDYLRRRAHRFIHELIPSLSFDTLDTLMRASIETFNAGTIVLRHGVESRKVYLLLTGTVEYHHPDLITPISAPTGSILGAQAVFQDGPMIESWRATSDVRVVRFGVKNLQAMLNAMNAREYVQRHLQEIGFLQRSWIFGTQINTIKHSQLVLNSRPVSLAAGTKLPSTGTDKLHLLRSGQIRLTAPDGKFLENLRPGDFFGEEYFLGRAIRNWQLEAIGPVELISLDSSVIDNTPIVLWKLHEIDQRRLRLAATP
jgi:hemerythrin